MSFRSLGLVVALGLLALGRAAAAQPPLGDETGLDLRHTIQARKLLFDDPELASLNLGVRVRNRVAYLWGPVPSADRAFRAEIRLRNLIELVDVRNELFVTGEVATPPEEPLPPLPAQPLLLPEQLPPALPSTIRTTQKPPPPDFELPALVVPGQNDAGQKLTQAVEELVRSRDVFRPYRYEVRDGRVYLRAAGANPAYLQELARAVARLPGVQGVVVQDKSSR